MSDAGCPSTSFLKGLPNDFFSGSMGPILNGPCLLLPDCRRQELASHHPGDQRDFSVQLRQGIGHAAGFQVVLGEGTEVLGTSDSLFLGPHLDLKCQARLQTNGHSNFLDHGPCLGGFG